VAGSLEERAERLEVVRLEQPAPEAHDPCTHLANAHRIRKIWGDRLLKVRGIGWHTRTDGPWTLSEAEALRIVQSLGKVIANEAAYLATGSKDDRDIATNLLKWASKSEQLHTLRDSLAMAEPLLYATAEDMDSDPYLVGLPGKVLDLRNGTQRPYTPDDRITLTLGADFSPTDTAPNWRKFLAEVLDPETLDYLQRLCGYALCGERNSHLLPIWLGFGRNGKSTAANVLAKAYGGYAGYAMPDLLTGRDTHSSSIATLRGKRLVFAAESGEGRHLAEERIKALTGGDPITAKLLYQEPFTFKPTHLLTLFTNHRPIVRGSDNGIWRRLRLIPWEVTISSEHEDTTLPERLQDELPGVLAWCLDGWEQYQAEGLNPPEKVTAATADYRTESDSLGSFLDDCCVLQKTLRVTSTALYSAYESWCHTNGERPLAQRTLAARLREYGIDSHKGSGGRRELLGVGLLSTAENYREATNGS